MSATTDPSADQRPGGTVLYYSPNRAGEHPRQHLADWSGILQAAAYGGYSRLHDAGRQPGPITEAGYWSHARRTFFDLADLAASARRKADGNKPVPISPLAHEIAQCMDRLPDRVAAQAVDEIVRPRTLGYHCSIRGRRRDLP
jgi:hypothetical protein